MRRQVLINWTLILAGLLAFILVPFVLFEEPLSAWTLARMRANPGGSFALVTAALASDIFLPVPSSIVSTLAGAFLGFPLGLAASWLGMTIGSIAGYWFGATAGRAVIEKAAGSPRELERATALRERYGDWAIIAARPVPVLAEATVIAAGFTKMPFGRFLAWNALSNLGVSAAYVYTGAFAAERESFLLAFAGAMLLPAIAILAMRTLKPSE